MNPMIDIRGSDHEANDQNSPAFGQANNASPHPYFGSWFGRTSLFTRSFVPRLRINQHQGTLSPLFSRFQPTMLTRLQSGSLRQTCNNARGGSTVANVGEGAGATTTRANAAVERTNTAGGTDVAPSERVQEPPRLEQMLLMDELARHEGQPTPPLERVQESPPLEQTRLLEELMLQVETWRNQHCHQRN
jgi:hypothetical protein